VKSNIGHTQAAAGMAGLIKVVQAMRHGLVPATLQVDAPSPHVDWSAGAVELAVSARPWPQVDRPRRAAVSAFGISGTNAHVVVERSFGAREPDGDAATAQPVVLAVSGASDQAVRDQAARLAAHVLNRPEDRLADIGWSLVTTRAARPERAAVLARDRADLLAGLRAVSAGEPSSAVLRGTAMDGGRTVFVFPGQGSQWAGMAVELMESSPVFAEWIDRCGQALAPYLDWDLVETLRSADALARYERTDVVQPALWAVIISLAELWRAHGVVPDAVLGHSQGEIAAAYVAGVLSLDDSARAVARRGQSLRQVSGSSGLLSISRPSAAIDELIRSRPGISVAAINGPASVVLAGSNDRLDALRAELAADGVRASRVAIDYASHSPFVEPIRDLLTGSVGTLTGREGEIRLFSTVTADWLPGRLFDADYVYQNLRRPVRFDQAVRSLVSQGYRHFVEVSPHPVLTTAIEETIEDLGAEREAVVLGTLRRADGSPDRFLTSLAELYTHGGAVDWTAVFPGARHVDLPTYPFQHQRYSLRSGAAVPKSTVDDHTEARFWQAVEQRDRTSLAGLLTVNSEAAEAILTALAPWHEQRRERALVEGLSYQVRWRRIDQRPLPQPCGHWLALLPTDPSSADWCTKLLDSLNEAGMPITAAPVDDPERVGDVLERHLLTGQEPVAGILSLLAIDETPMTAQPAVSAGLAATLALAKAMSGIDKDLPVRLVTRSAVSVGGVDRTVHPIAAQTLGLSRVVLTETAVDWRMVDLPDQLGSDLAARLAGFLTRPGAEDQIALRDSGTYVPRLVPLPTAISPAEPAWSAGGTVLVTGGFGAVGGHVARWLADRGARQLLLLGRRGAATPGATELIADLRSRGAEVTAVAVDAADRQELGAVLREHPPTAVFHAAGVVDDGVLDQMTVDRLATVLRPKAEAARHLHELTRDLDLTAFVLFSSAAHVLGNGGQGNYAAANAYLDALAEQRRADGLPATSIAWGAWAAGGLADDPVVEQRLARTGLSAIPTHQALRALQATLDDGATTRVVCAVDWGRFSIARGTTEIQPLLRELPQLRGHSDGTGLDEPAPELSGLAAAEQQRLLVDLVRGHLAAVLGHADPAEVDMDRAPRDLGLDSLSANEIRNRLARDTGLKLATTLVFDHPSGTALAAALRARLSGERAGAPVAAASAVGALLVDGDDPVVVVGMACRFPGGVRSPDDLWQVVVNGRDVVGEWPLDRGWDQGLYDPDRVRPGTTYTRCGGFLDDADKFDAAFFGISPREALAMDPQQRLTLETSWQAIESAGIDAHALRGTRTGVYIGGMSQEYGPSLIDADEEGSGYLITGAATSVISGRVSYVLGLEGPAITVDTACSSSLVALHLAAQALRSDECDLALAGGVTVMSSPGLFLEFSRQGGLAPDGRCKAFGEGADGTGWSEGCGVLVVERLATARRRNHRVLAVLRGSAVNQDGASNGLSAPNGQSQQRVITSALAAAGLGAGEIDVVEAHGTGTRLGDPIEAHALIATYGRDRPAESPLHLGSVKSNIGHTQAAAGVAGVIKIIQAMRHRTIPPTLHAKRPSEHVDWADGNISLTQEPQPWRTSTIRRAGISAFGISGTNAHLVVEQSPAVDPVARQESGDIAWVMSGKTAEALRRQAVDLAAQVATHPDAEPADIGWTLAKRAVHPHRAVLIAQHVDQFNQQLNALTTGDTSTGLTTGTARAGRRIAVLFSGQDAQTPGMGRELYAAYPEFAAALDEACAHLDPALAMPLRSVMFADPDTPPAALLDRTQFTQPALFAFEVALFRLLTAWGLVPEFLMGHSVGELAAAHIAGILSLADASWIVLARSRLMSALPEGGAMVSVRASERRLMPLLAEETDVSVAAVNGPESVVLSGDRAALARVVAVLTTDGVATRWLRVSHAFHSASMDPMLAEFRDILAGIGFGPTTIPIVSNLTGTIVTDRMRTAEYWVDQARRTVRFADGIGTLRAAGVDTFLEIGPTAAIAAMAADCLEAADHGEVVVVPTQRPGVAQDSALLDALARLFVAGAIPRWPATDSRRGSLVDLPAYPFRRQRYWPDPRPRHSRSVTPTSLGTTAHPFFEFAVTPADGNRVLLTGRLSVDSQPWLADHAVAGTLILPGTGMLEMFAHAGDHVGCSALEDLTHHVPLVLSDHGGTRIQVIVDGADARGRRAASLYSQPDDAQPGDAWVLHASGVLAATGSPVESVADAPWPPPAATALDVADLYDHMAADGYPNGPAFRGVRAAWTNGAEIYTEVELPAPLHDAAPAFGIHPALLDAALHGVRLGEFLGELRDLPGNWIPFTWAGVTWHRRGARTLRVRLTPVSPGVIRLKATDPDGELVIRVDSLVLRPLSARTATESHAVTGPRLLRRDWRAVDVPASDVRGDDLVVVGPDVFGLCAAGVATRAVAGLADLHDDVPAAVLVCLPDAEAPADLGDRVHAAGRDMLAIVRAWLAERRFDRSRLVVVTSSAVAVGISPDHVDLVHALIWGLIGSAQAEHPDRFALIDIDDDPRSRTVLAAAVQARHTQTAIRAGDLLVPVLTTSLPADHEQTGVAPTHFDPLGTVLITGGLGGLGAEVSTHLVTHHHVRHLVLTGRRGMDTPGAASLCERLREVGAEVQVVGCDVADHDALAAVLGSIPDRHPLRAVVHLAGVVDDGLIGTLTDERLDAVLRPKVDAVLNLHEQTRQLDLTAFVLFSSAAGVMGSPGQAGYAAANVFLDAFATYRRHLGLPGVSLAWGPWTPDSGMTAHLSDVDMSRIARTGLRPLTVDEGLALLDTGCRAAEPALVATALAAAGTVSSDDVPDLLRELVPARLPVRPAAAPPPAATALAMTLADRFAHADDAERATMMLDLVTAQLAMVLGYQSGADVDPELSLMELGLDSLAATELRYSLSDATGLTVSEGLVLAQPTATALSQQLLSDLIDGLAAPDSRPGTVTAPSNPVAALFAAAYELGRVEEGLDLAARAAALRPQFTAESDSRPATKLITLAKGGRGTQFVCVPPLVDLAGGHHQYSRLAGHLSGGHDVALLPTPGFRADELLASTLDVLVKTQAEALMRTVETGPAPVLVGYSSGGWLAYAMAQYLEQHDVAVRGIVLVDSHSPDAPFIRELGPRFIGLVYEQLARTGVVVDPALTAMAWYVRQFGQWQPADIAAPTVLLRASEPLPGIRDLCSQPQAPDWPAVWTFADQVVDVPGDHVSVIAEETTAQAIKDWLAAR
jgi:acyl transferase domain-containing protein/thioesterase domain-containing protein/acyl carrier protein